MKIVPQVEGAVYPALQGQATFVEFPAVLPASAVRAASRGGATTGLPTDPSLIGIFVGQVPFSLPPGYLAWFVNQLVGEDCVLEALMARNQSCGRIVLPVERAQALLLLSETALFDSTGVWIARTPKEHLHLTQFCASLGQGQFGSQVLRHALPKKCVVLRLQQRPRQSRPPDVAVLPPPQTPTTIYRHSELHQQQAYQQSAVLPTQPQQQQPTYPLPFVTRPAVPTYPAMVPSPQLNNIDVPLLSAPSLHQLTHPHHLQGSGFMPTPVPLNYEAPTVAPSASYYYYSVQPGEPMQPSFAHQQYQHQHQHSFHHHHQHPEYPLSMPPPLLQHDTYPPPPSYLIAGAPASFTTPQLDYQQAALSGLCFPNTPPFSVVSDFAPSATGHETVTPGMLLGAPPPLQPLPRPPSSFAPYP